MKRSITVRHTFEGWHHWPEAPGRRAYLAAKHRHMFWVDTTVTVGHDDREIEFHDLRDTARAATPGGDLGSTSCEQLAERVIGAVRHEWPGREYTVTVWEDNECGATVTETE